MAPHKQRKGNKEHFWRGLLKKWQQSSLTIRAFCAKHHVSEPSFYFWKRTLLLRDHQPPPAAKPDHPTQPQPLFVPLRLVPTLPHPCPVLEVVLDQRRLVRVPQGFDAATLRQLLAVLEETSC
jgi:hypothetical protein